MLEFEKGKEVSPPSLAAAIIDNFIEYVENEIKDALSRSPLVKALDYAKKHLSGFKNILLNGYWKLIIMLLKEPLNLLLLEERIFYSQILLKAQQLALSCIVL